MADEGQDTTTTTTTTTETPLADGRDPKTAMVPITRLQSAKAEVRDLKAQVAALAGERDGLKATAAKVTDAEARAAAAVEALGLAREGLVDDEGIDVARTVYARMTGDDKPASLVDAVKAWKADAAKAPKAVAPYLGLTTTTTTTTPAKVTTPNPSGGGATGQPAIGGQIDAAALVRLTAAAQGKGAESAEVKALRAALGRA